MTTTATAMFEPQAKVRWAGKMHPNCRPGMIGIVLTIAHHDLNSIKVRWEDRPAMLGVYTWERAKNLTVIA